MRMKFSVHTGASEAFVTIARDNRSEPTLDEIAVLDGLVRGLENLANLQLDRL
jgi:hypothetical protein